MFIRALSKPAKSALETLTKNAITDDFYLAGGSCVALYLGHRVSVDLDFFSTDLFETGVLIQRLSRIGDFTVQKEAWGTVVGTLNDAKVSFMVYDYPLLF
jgi:hypothetical protein